MLKDIKNVMASKRVHSDSSSSSTCSLVNVVTNKKYNLSYDEKFVIGRSLECSLIIEALYISRRHCIIEYENNEFIVYDNTTCSGTFVNGEKIPKGKSNFNVRLKHGDLIGFGEKRKLNFIFQFCMFSNDMKKPKFDSKQENTVPVQEKIDKKALLKLHSEALNLKVKYLVLINKTKTELSEYQKTNDTTLECVSKLNETVIKQKDIIEDLTKKISEYHGTLMIQQDCLDNKNLLQDSTIEVFKNQVNNLLENDLQCPICNEVLFKAVTAGCYHTFCGCCLTTWLSKSKVCPVCRAEVKTITNCLAMDNFVTNLCELVGGTVKEQRDNLVKERISLAVTPGRARRGRSRRGRGRIIAPSIVVPRIQGILEPYNRGGVSIRLRDDIEVVDLTNNSYNM